MYCYNNATVDISHPIHHDRTKLVKSEHILTLTFLIYEDTDPNKDLGDKMWLPIVVAYEGNLYPQLEGENKML